MINNSTAVKILFQIIKVYIINLIFAGILNLTTIPNDYYYIVTLFFVIGSTLVMLMPIIKPSIKKYTYKNDFTSFLKG